MKQALIFSIMALILVLFSFACSPINYQLPPTIPSPAATVTPTKTPTIAGTPINTATPTTTCTGTTYSANYSSNTLGNYSYYDGGWTASSASALEWNIASSELQEAVTTWMDSYIVANNSTFSQSLGDYKVEGDFKLDTVGQGVFGLVFRATAASGLAYIFQWNGVNGRWEIEKQYNTGGTSYYYPGTNSSSPYTLGTWIHLKVVAGPGNLFNAWITPAGGPTQQIFSGVTD